ncbi:MAG TPA: N-acetyl-gamma-glutamyl-phosphate reductase [Rhizomicrobium sp.]|jgi:N-acetyl-gamma-glutamyl-phosphate reductase
MQPQVFIDGAAGTTGLEIAQRLAGRADLQLVRLAEHDRKNAVARARALNEADLVVLCLPDDAAREAVTLITNPDVRVLDASSAHRTAEGWAYGFAEIAPKQRGQIAAARRVSNPGCYPTGFLGLVAPLVRAGLLPADFPLTVNAVSGYSGGGRAMIEEFEDAGSPRNVKTVVRTYGLTQAHKHLPEMQKHAGLAHPPVFSPSVGRYFRGMLVDVPLPLWALPGRPSIGALHAALTSAYAGEDLVKVVPLAASHDLAALDAERLKGTDRMELFVFGNDNAARLIAVLDNLGKGASGAAVQNLNLMLGLPESAGLT